MTFDLPWALTAIPVGTSYSVVPYRELEKPSEYQSVPAQIYMGSYMRNLLDGLADAGGRCDLASIYERFCAERNGDRCWETNRADMVIQTAITNGLVYYDDDCLYRLTQAGWKMAED